MSGAVRAVWAGLAIFVASNAANAQTINKTMAAGSVLTLTNLASVNPDCTSRGKTIVRVVTAPSHASIALREGQVFSVFPRRPQCNTVRVHGVAVMYRPTPNFVGSDFVSLEVIYPSGNEHTESYAITVK
jgi:hypothetical protein